MNELTLNLLFSATFDPMHGPSKPPREIRIAHNYARRLLADEYGLEEFQSLVGEVKIRTFWRRHPAIFLPALLGAAYFMIHPMWRAQARAV